MSKQAPNLLQSRQKLLDTVQAIMDGTVLPTHLYNQAKEAVSEAATCLLIDDTAPAADLRYIEKDIVNASTAIGLVAECNATYTTMLASAVHQTGKRLIDLTVAELLQLQSECGELYNSMYRDAALNKTGLQS
jgi:hypothetical protein